MLVTDARLSRRDDQRTRQRRYFASQGLRVLAILLQAFPLPAWARVLLIGAAVCLPWAGVVQANAGQAHTLKHDRAAEKASRPVAEVTLPALTAGKVIDAEVVDAAVIGATVVDAEPVRRSSG